MRVLKKILRITTMLIFIFLLLFGIWWFWPARTLQLESVNNKSVSKIEYIEIGEVEQCILTRGKNTDNPILLFLHGGPGMPMMYMAHEFQSCLEENFIVVQWDRRGAGKTYSRNIPSEESMNVRQLLEDAYTLIDTLKQRYHQDKVILVGHSFGTYIGSIMVTEKPELFSAYVSIGQVVDSEKAKIFQEKFIKERAIIENRTDILNKLNDSIKPNYEYLLFEFGGELKNSKSFFPLIWSGLKAPEYKLSEVLNVAKGSAFSSAHMKYNVLSHSIYDEIKEYKIPIYFFVGKSDYTTPHELISKYYESIKSPKKEIVYFDDSAHFPFFEEPERFCEEINRVLLENN